MLDSPNEPLSDLSYFHCIESVMENSKVLGESMAGISQNCKLGNVGPFGDCVGSASKALCGLTEAAAQAAYLVGVSDPNSQAGHQGLVDPIQFAKANQAIHMACQNLAVENLTTFASNPEFASVPAKISRQGCAAQEPIVQSARSMLVSSTHLLQTARSLVINPKDPPTWSVLAGHSRTVSDSIKALITAIRTAPGPQSSPDLAAAQFDLCWLP
ncbi:hypothetical protein CRUP_030418 [Coryphaenoides rupestris]|nr:hypothetical protein CRUP_030418 [Coryphaenoides rupestris]